MWAQNRHEQATGLVKALLRGARASGVEHEPLLVPQMKTLLGKWQSKRR